MSHTPEPWRIDKQNDNTSSSFYIRGTKANGEQMTFGLGAVAHIPRSKVLPSEANAKRIVACVNACAGIPTDDLNEVTEKGMSIFTVCAAAEHGLKQRDTLLAALKASRATLERANTIGNTDFAIIDTIWHTKHETLFDFMDEAIASVESPTKEQPK